jgi:hypothetical protein
MVDLMLCTGGVGLRDWVSGISDWAFRTGDKGLRDKGLGLGEGIRDKG